MNALDAVTAKAWAHRDLRQACIHEWAHAVVARRFGIFGWVEIYENESPLAGLAEKFYLARFRSPCQPKTNAACKAIGLAGLVAEEIDNDPEVQGFELYESLTDGTIELSATDASLVGCFDETDLEFSVALARDLRPQITREAALQARGWISAREYEQACRRP